MNRVEGKLVEDRRLIQLRKDRDRVDLTIRSAGTQTEFRRARNMVPDRKAEADGSAIGWNQIPLREGIAQSTGKLPALRRRRPFTNVTIEQPDDILGESFPQPRQSLATDPAVPMGTACGSKCVTTCLVRLCNGKTTCRDWRLLRELRELAGSERASWGRAWSDT